MASYLSAIVVAAVVCMANAGEESTSNYCKSVVQSNLDIQKLNGEWWEQASFNTDSFVEPDDTCHVFNFYPAADSKTVHVLRDYVNTENKHKSGSLVIEDNDPNNDGNLEARLRILKPALGKKKVEWDILKTDYENFMLVQICYDGPGDDNDFKAGLLLSKKQQGIDLNSAEIKKQIKDALDENKLDRSVFQANEIESCAAVTFPENFTPVEDDDGSYCQSVVEQKLEIQQLKGEWWEQESYNTDSFVERNDKCHVSSFYPTADSKKIHVFSDYVNTDNEHKQFSYVIEDKDTKDDGNLVAHMKILKPALGNKLVEWDILKTDYTNFILVQICHDGPGDDDDFKAGLLLVKKQQGINLNSRAIKKAIKDALDQNNLDRSYFQANAIESCGAVTFPESFTASEE